MHILNAVRWTSMRSRLGVAALALGATVAPLPVHDQPAEVTQADIDRSNQKVAMAYAALVDMWQNDFAQIGERFVAPRIARYRGAVRTPCGVIQPNNAQYCSASNAIYYDDVFVAGMAKVAAARLRTDGDMTGIGIIAHEMGHAVAMQLGYRSRNSYANEATADCLAGAFARQSQRDGSLEPGDMDEAIFGMAMAGDPEVEPTGNPRYDAVIQRRLARQAHGTQDQRVRNFRKGVNGGPGACLDDFADLR